MVRGLVLKAVIALLALLILTNCADDRTPSRSPFAEASADTGHMAQTGAVTVKLVVTEFGIESSLTSFKVGTPYHFIVTNKGVLAHELVLTKPKDPEMASITDLYQFALSVVQENDLPSGARREFDVIFQDVYSPGTLEFACHIQGHYEAGMKLALAVD